MRIFLCDDDAAFCMLVEIWLEDRDDLEFVGSATTRASALTALGPAGPGLVLLDTTPEGVQALTVAEVRAAAPGAKVVVYSGHPRDVAVGLLGGGPDLYLTKDHGPPHLLDAIDRLRAGGPESS